MNFNQPIALKSVFNFFTMVTLMLTSQKAFCDDLPSPPPQTDNNSTKILQNNRSVKDVLLQKSDVLKIIVSNKTKDVIVEGEAIGFQNKWGHIIVGPGNDQAKICICTSWTIGPPRSKEVIPWVRIKGRIKQSDSGLINIVSTKLLAVKELQSGSREKYVNSLIHKRLLETE